MPFADRLASRVVGAQAAPGVVSCSGLRCERLARFGDCAQAMLPARLGHAPLAVPAPTLEHGRATQLAGARRSCEGFGARRAPGLTRVRARLRRFARRFDERRALWRGRRATWTLAYERVTEDLCEALGDRHHAQAPLRQRECEVVELETERERRTSPVADPLTGREQRR